MQLPYLAPRPSTTMLFADVAGPTSPLELFTTLTPILVVVLGGVVAGLWTAHNRRKGATESRFPDVNEIWSQQARQSIELDNERKLRRKLEDYSGSLLRAFRGYVRRVVGGGSTALTSHEKSLIDSEPPTLQTVINPPA